MHVLIQLLEFFLLPLHGKIKVIFQVLYSILVCSRKAESQYLSSFSVIEKYLLFFFFSHFSAFPIIYIAELLPQYFQDCHLPQTEILEDKLAGLTCTLRRNGCSRRMGAVPLWWLHPCICQTTCDFRKKRTTTILTTLGTSSIHAEQG